MLKKRWLSISGLLLLVMVIVAGCGGGGGSSSNNNNNPPAKTLAGVAAAGAPIVGVVNVKGANGATASANIDNTGHFSLDVTNLTANYIMYAEGTVNGKTIRIYSAAVAEGNINITPITDLIVANAYQGLPSNAYSAWNGSQISASTLSAAQTQVNDDLAPLLISAGVSTTTNLMTASFNADGTGVDKALDYLNVTYNGTTATVTNTATGSSYTNSVTNPGAAVGLPPSDTTTTQTVMTDADGINVFWQKFKTLWATSVPSQTNVNSQLGPLVATDMLDAGVSDKATQIANWASDDGIPLGIKFTAIISGPMDVTGTTYTKGCWINVNYVFGSDSGSFVSSMVYDGTKWLFYGDRRWVNFDLEALASMHVPASGSPTLASGFNLYLNDEYNYASNHGVQSAIVTGPGLPASGLKMELVFPNTVFSLYQPVAPSYGAQYYISDSAIGLIPDNATYTFNFYAVSAASVILGVDTPIHSFTQIFAKAPIKTANLNAALFPTLTAPTTHDISIVHIPGTLPVSWTNPANEYVSWVWLGWSDGSSSWRGIGNNLQRGATSTTIDTTTFSAVTPMWANLWMESYDSYGRMYVLNWDFASGGGGTLPPTPTTVTISGVATAWTGTTSVPVPGLTITARHPADVDNSNPIAQTTSGTGGSYSLSVPSGTDLYLNMSGTSGGIQYTSWNSRIFRNMTQAPDLSNGSGEGFGTMSLTDMNSMVNSVTYNGSAYSGGVGTRAWLLADAFDAATMSNKISGVTFSGTPAIVFLGYNDGTNGTSLVSPPTRTATAADTGNMITSSAVAYNNSAVIVTATASKSGSPSQTCELPLVPGEVTYKQVGF